MKSQENNSWQDENIANLEWKDEYNVGVEAVDNAHKKLFSVVKRLNSLVHHEDNEKNKWVCTESVKFMKEYALWHFENEEEYMRSINYPGYDKHKEAHIAFKEKTLPEIESELIDSEFSFDVVEEFIGICMSWLTMHIMIYDRDITRTDESKIQNIVNSCFSNAICTIIEEIFTIPTTMTSNNLEQQDINNTINFELTYSDTSDKEHKVLIILDKNFVLKSAGHMANVTFSEVDGVVLASVITTIKLVFSQLKSIHCSKENLNTINNMEQLTNEKLNKKLSTEVLTNKFIFHTEFGNIIICKVKLDK